jgi:hypothetical protein
MCNLYSITTNQAAILILLHFATSPDYPSGTALEFLRNSHAIQVTLLYMLVPLTLTSVFFYASIAPSIWLWLFVLAAITSRTIAPSWPAAIYVFNFEQSPMRVIGLAAAAIVLLLGSFALAVGSLWWTTLLALIEWR